MAAEGRDNLLEGGSGACDVPPGPYSTGWRDSDPPRDIDGGLDSLCEEVQKFRGID